MELSFDARVGMFRGATFSELTLKSDLQRRIAQYENGLKFELPVNV